jgi:exodeoxyribonuclease V alpha subunit
VIVVDEKTTGLLQERGVLGPIDAHFGRALARLSKSDDPLLEVAAALASRAVQAGHVCLDLGALGPLAAADGEPLDVSWPTLAAWQAALEKSEAVSDGSRTTPLVLREGHHLYLHRYAEYEARLAQQLRSRLGDPFELDEVFLAKRFTHYFGELAKDAPLDEQRLATLLGLRGRLAVISGGPGTGKTWTVTRLLLLLHEHGQQQGKVLNVALLAPTGKAAQRLSESLQHGLSELGFTPEQAPIATSASTIHRALRTLPRSPTRFRHNQSHPLPHDVVVIDEASMVDLALMTKLVEAISRDARLILLGDRDQLASVEAGAIFGDILGSSAHSGYSSTLVEAAERVLGQRPLLAPSSLQSKGTSEVSVRDATIHLRKSRRYADDSGIGRVAEALRGRDPDAVVQALSREEAARLVRIDDDLGPLEDAIVDGYGAYATERDPERRLSLLDGFRLLTAHREGRRGVADMNQLCERVLGTKTPLVPRSGPYDGQPIIIVDNDYQLELWNGDVGVIGHGEGVGRLVAYFRRGDGVRRIPLSRLPAHETVFAMTVHKSQGSEFDRIALVLPRHPSPVLTRELLYTAITRAKHSVRVFGAEAVLLAGVRAEIRRASGLSARLSA